MYTTHAGMDFNDAGQSPDSDLIPAGTVAKVVIAIRPGGSGLGGWLTESKTSDVEYLNCEFTLLDGTYARRKFWQNMAVAGGKLDEHGQPKGWIITRAALRAMLDSAMGLDPDDNSPEARQKRITADWGSFNGLEFTARIGIEKGKYGYPDKTRLQGVVTRAAGKGKRANGAARPSAGHDHKPPF